MSEKYKKYRARYKNKEFLKEYGIPPNNVLKTSSKNNTNQIAYDNKKSPNKIKTNRQKNITQNNNYIKIDLNNYKNNNINTKKDSKSLNINIPRTKKIETITIDINKNENKVYNSYRNNNLNTDNNLKKVNFNNYRRANNNNQKNKSNQVVYKKYNLNKNDETGSLSMRRGNDHILTKSSEIRNQSTNEGTIFKNNINNTNRKIINLQRNNISQSKTFDNASNNKNTVNNDYHLLKNNNYNKSINKNNTNVVIKTEPSDNYRKKYNNNINLNKNNNINTIENKHSNDYKRNNFIEYNIDKNNIQINNKNNNNKYLYNEESKDNESMPKQKSIVKYEEQNKKNSDLFIVEKNSFDNFKNNELSDSSNSIVEANFVYKMNSYKDKKDEINIDNEYFKKYINDNKYNKNEKLIKNNNIKTEYNDDFGKIEENVDFRESCIKPSLNLDDYKNNEEENISKLFSIPSSIPEKNINNKIKEHIISDKSSSNNIKNNNNSNSNKNKNINLRNQKEKMFNNNLDIKKDSLNDNHLEDSSHYNMNFYDSGVININSINSNINSNMNSNINSNKNILKKKLNDKNEFHIDNNSSSNSHNYNDYNNYYNNILLNSINDSLIIKNEKEFINLIPNLTFQKFLTSKIKYYMNEDSIPKKFISDCIVEKNLRKIKEAKNLYNNIDLNIVNNFKNKNKHKSNILKEKELELVYPKKIIHTYNKGGEKDESSNEYEIINKKYNRRKILLKEEHEIKKSLLLEENKELMLKINELQQCIDNSKNKMEERDNQIKRYLTTYDKISTENEQIKKKIENLEYELNAKNNEVEEKKKKIYELNNLNSNLENKMNELKKEYVNEAINNKETKENYVIIKNNYNDIKNQYDLLNIKYQTLSDENYNFRRDKLLYEKELKTKNLMIENLLQSNTNIKQKELKRRLDEVKLNKIEEIENEKYFDIKENNENKENENTKEEIVINKAKEEDIHKFDECGLDELMSKRDELLRDRKNTTNEYYKIPNKANSQQIKKRNELEIKLDQINNELDKIRIRINILKNNKNY